MKIYVTAKAKAKVDRVEKLSSNVFKVHTKAPPLEGKANAAISKLLAEHFKVPQPHVTLLRGATKKQKIFEIV